MEALLAKIKKSGGTELWVALHELQGRQFVDAREYFLSGDDREWHPTKKGIMLDPEHLPAVIDGIEALDGSSHVTVKVIRKGERAEIRIGFRQFEGHNYGEVRIWYMERDVDEMRPSPKGITFNLDVKELLIEALREAEDQLD